MESDADCAIVHQATYTYDSRDRRIGVELDGARTWTVYDGVNTYADFDGSGTLATRYLHGPAIDALLARTSSAGDTAWYLTDRLGSVRDLADTSGTVIDHVSYDSFGNILSESNPSAGDRFKYTAREFDPTTGLQSNRARYFHAPTGRWSQLDPIGFAGGDVNLYRYVSNAPTLLVDPSGETERLPEPFPEKPNERSPYYRTNGSANEIRARYDNLIKFRQTSDADCTDLMRHYRPMQRLYSGRVHDYMDSLDQDEGHWRRIELERDHLKRLYDKLQSNCGMPGGGGFAMPTLPRRPNPIGTTTATGTEGSRPRSEPSLSPGSGYGPVNSGPKVNPLDPAEPGFLFPRIYPATPRPMYNPYDPRINPPPVRVPKGPLAVPPPRGPIRIPVRI